MSNILALDLSTKRTGWSTIVDGKYKYGVIASASNDVEKRIGIMRDSVIKIIDEYKIDTVIMEEVRPDGYNNRTGKVLNWLQGCVTVAIYEFNKKIKVDTIGVSSWRKVLGIQRYGVKRDEYKRKDIDFVNQNYGLKLEYNQDDEADAICILTAYMKDRNGIVIAENKPQFEEIGSGPSAF